MPNHYHLLARTPRGNPSRASRHINGLYTQHCNRRHGLDGPLFRGRYRAMLVDADAYLLLVSRYIHRDPIGAEQPRVERSREWCWSSSRVFVGEDA